MHIQHEHELSSSLFFNGRIQTSSSIIKASNCSYFATIYLGVCLRQASVFFNPSQHQISSFGVFFHTVTPIYWEEGTGTHLSDRQLLWLRDTTSCLASLSLSQLTSLLLSGCSTQAIFSAILTSDTSYQRFKLKVQTATLLAATHG